MLQIIIPRLIRPPEISRSENALRSIEFPLGRSLFGTDSARNDFGARIILRAYVRTGQATQHRDLSDVSERVSRRSLEKFFGCTTERRIRGDIIVKRFQTGEEPLHPIVPSNRFRIAPLLFSADLRKSPIQQIANVSQNLTGSASSLGSVEFREAGRSAAHRFAATVGDRRQHMAQELPASFRRIFS